jgi:ABC-type Fe3+ transport system substrate-binding protein
MKRQWVGLLTLALLLVGCAAPAGSGTAPTGARAAATPAAGAAAPAATFPPAVQQLIEGAKGEGELKLAWGGGAFGAESGVQLLNEAFNRKYGLNARFDFKLAPSMPAMGATIGQEIAAGRTPSVDVYLGNEPPVVELVKQRAFEPVRWAELVPGLDSRSITEDMVVMVATRDLGITYNTRLVRAEELPRTLGDMVDPKWRGRLASTPYMILHPLATSELWGEEKTFDYIRGLSANVKGLIRCGEEERIISGEYAAFVADCGSYSARLLQDKGAPVGHVTPEDVVMLQGWFMGVPRGAAHPNTAKLFVALMLSPEGQEIAWQTTRIDNHLLPGSRQAEEFKKLEAKGARVVLTDVNWFLRMEQEGVEVPRLERELLAIIEKK